MPAHLFSMLSGKSEASVMPSLLNSSNIDAFLSDGTMQRPAITGSRPYFDYQRDLVLSNIPKPTDQAKWLKQCCEDTLFVYGTRYLDRQAAQSGQYILFPNDIREKDPSLSFDDLISPLPKVDMASDTKLDSDLEFIKRCHESAIA